MLKDPRYSKVGYLITDGRINTFRDILNILPKSVMASDLRMNNTQFKKLRNNISLFRLKDLFTMAALLEIEEWTILTLIYNERKMNEHATSAKAK
jgi:hypothetical protein